MASPFNDVVVLRPGDAEGNRMVVRVATHDGTDIHAVAVQDRPSRMGPTWTYLVQEEGLSLIDAGAIGSFTYLADGVRQAGTRLATSTESLSRMATQPTTGPSPRLEEARLLRGRIGRA